MSILIGIRLNHNPFISAIVLAAGLSRRMGQDNKLLLSYQGSTIIESVVDHLKASLADEIILVTSELSMEPLRSKYEGELTLVDNPHYRSGMTSSIQAGIRACHEGSHGFMICLGDQPNITTEVYNEVIEKFKDCYLSDKQAIGVPHFQGEKGNPVIFSSYYRGAINQNEEPEGCKPIVKTHQDHVALINVDSPAILEDVDNRQDYDSLISG